MEGFCASTTGASGPAHWRMSPASASLVACQVRPRSSPAALAVEKKAIFFPVFRLSAPAASSPRGASTTGRSGMRPIQRRRRTAREKGAHRLLR